MALRVYLCPVIGTGTRQDPYRSKAFAYYGGINPGQVTVFHPSKSRGDGSPASTWVISIIRANSFTSIAADATCDDLFAGDLPGTVVDQPTFVAFLAARTVADVPLARRNAITAVLDKYGVNRTDIVGTTPLIKVFQRVASALLEKDDNFGLAF
jgi:hypothetical protein